MPATHFKPTQTIIESSLPVWRQQQKQEVEPEQKKWTSSVVEKRSEKVVISGVACLFPEARDIEKYSQGLFDQAKKDQELKHIALQLEEQQRFDCQFFGISPEMAMNMTVVQKMTVEQIYESIFDAGLVPADLKKTRTGLFIATNLEKRENFSAEFFSTVFDFQGPAQMFEDQFSSSFIALDAARRAILSGKCDQAIVCGIEKMTGMVMPTVACVFVQKRDVCKRFYALVLESQVCPSTHLVTERMQKLYNDWNVDPTLVTYVENFGQQCDEYRTLAKVYATTERSLPVYIGSSAPWPRTDMEKRATGVQALIKMIVAIHAGRIPASYRQEELFVDEITKNVKWVKECTKFCGGLMVLNAFGLNGMNVNIVLQPNTDYMMSKLGNKTYWNQDLKILSTLPRLFTCASRTEKHLVKNLETIRQYPTDIAAQLLLTSTGCTTDHEKFRAFTVLNGEEEHHIRQVETTVRPVFYLFNGCINTDLLATYEQMMHIQLFRHSIERATECLRPYGLDLTSILTEQMEENRKRLDRQVAHTAIQVALIDCLRAAGIHHQGLIGYSIGELACAYADSCLTFEQTILTAYQRAKCIEEARMPSGAMAAVSLTWEQAQKRCPAGVTLACHNYESNVTVSGPLKTVEKFVADLCKEKIAAKILNTNETAYHSQYMTSIASQLKKRLEVIIGEPKVRSGKWFSTSIAQPRWNSEIAKLASPEYFVNNVCNHVLLKEAMQVVPVNAIVIEIGPQSVMQLIVKNLLPTSCYVPLLKKCEVVGEQTKMHSLTSFWCQLGSLYVQGVQMCPMDLFMWSVEKKSAYPVPVGTRFLSVLRRERECKLVRHGECECDNKKKDSLLVDFAEFKLEHVMGMFKWEKLGGEERMCLEELRNLLVECMYKQSLADLEKQYELIVRLEKYYEVDRITQGAVQQWRHIQELKECILEQLPVQITRQWRHYQPEQTVETAEKRKLTGPVFTEFTKYMQMYQQEKLAQVKYFLRQELVTVQQKRILEELETLIKQAPNHPTICIAQLQQQMELLQNLDILCPRQDAQQTRMIQDLKDIIREQIKYYRQPEDIKSAQPEQFKHQLEKQTMSAFPEHYRQAEQCRNTTIIKRIPVEIKQIPVECRILKQIPVECRILDASKTTIRQFHQLPAKTITNELAHKYQAKYTVDLTAESSVEELALLGHKIQGRYVYPASGFVYMIWKSFAKMNGFTCVEKCPIQFTNIKFLHQITLNLGDKVQFIVEINQLTGLFQLIDSSSLNKVVVVCTGCVESLNNLAQFRPCPAKMGSDTECETISQREVYMCLRQRGYDLEGDFQAISKSAIDGTYGEISWTGKWIQFLDGMIQMSLLAQKVEGTCLPTLIKSLRIEPSLIVVDEKVKSSVCFEKEEKNLDTNWLQEEYEFLSMNEGRRDGEFMPVNMRFEWFTKVQKHQQEKIITVRNWMRQQEVGTTLTVQQRRMFEELETLMCQFQRTFGCCTAATLTEEKFAEVLARIHEQYELVSSITACFNFNYPTVETNKQTIPSVRMIEDFRQLIREQLQYQEREQLSRQQKSFEQRHFNGLYRKQLDILRTLTQSQCRLPVEMNILEEMEKLIQEQQYRHKSMAPVEYTVQQWMCQLRQQEQMLNEHFLQAQHPEIISVYNFLAKFVKEQLQQEMDFQTECKQMYGFVHHKLSMNFNLIQKLIAISNSEQHGRQGEEEELGGTSPVKRMYLVKLEQIIQEMYDQTMLTQAIQESMHEACQTRCIQLKEYMNLLENLTINKTKLTTNHREDRFAELKDIQITLEKYQRDAAEYIVKHVESRQFRKDEDKKINTVPVYYNAQTRSLWSRGIELTGLYMAPVNSDYPVVSVTPVAVRQPEQRFTLDQEKEINMLKKNEMIEMDLLNLIEAMHSLESLRDTAECLRDTALSMRKQEQQKPMKLSAKFTTKVSFSPLQAYISSSLDEAERQLIEETMASLTQTTITPVQAKKYNYLMPQKCIEPLNEVEIYAQFQNQEQAMTPVVIVHPIEGHTNTLRNLAKNIRAPVYGIQYTREALKYETVEELAQYYWTQIKKVFGDNARVHLCGHAFGAMVAMEMAICKPARCVSLTILDDNVEKISYDMYREAREEMEADALMKFALQYYQTMNKVQFFQQLTEFKTTEQRIRFVVRELVNRSQFQFETLDLDWAARAYITKYVMHCMYTPKSQLRLPTVYYVKCGGEKRCESPLVKIASVRRTYLKSLIEQCFAGKLKTESVECDVRSFLEGNNGYQVATIMNENLLRHF